MTLIRHSQECDDAWARFMNADPDMMVKESVEAMEAFIRTPCPLCDDPEAVFRDAMTLVKKTVERIHAHAEEVTKEMTDDPQG